mmetsp:Transcript_22723/g.38830  ORF Transcript_22723/g.38830 Transcript_22723/m.38830 type:complete len:173 (+) Transcript_22723:220-738(+)
MKLFGRQRQHPELHRQSSDESYSSTTSPTKSKTHRRTPSFSDASVKSSTTDPLNVSWSSCGSGALLTQVDMVDHHWPESKIGSDSLGGGEEDKRSSLRVLEIIRQLSFSPPRKTKKRADIADTASSSSSSDTHDEHSTSIGLLDLQHLEDLRRGSPSPLLGLQYLPDGDMFI